MLRVLIFVMGVLFASTHATYSITAGDFCSGRDWQWRGKADGSADCRTYFACSNGVVVNEMCNCGDTDLAKCRRFNPITGYCDWYGNVPCIDTEVTTRRPIIITPMVTETQITAEPAIEPSRRATLGDACTNDMAADTTDPECRSYIRCINGRIWAIFQCRIGTLYDVTIRNCNWASFMNIAYVYACQRGLATVAPPTVAPVTLAPTPIPTTSIIITEPDITSATIDEGRAAVGGPCTTDMAVDTTDPECRSYIRCVSGRILAIFQCPVGTLYDITIMNCNWAYNMDFNYISACQAGVVPETTTEAPTTAIPVTTATPAITLITLTEFINAVTACGYPAPSTEQYNDLVRYAGPIGGITTKSQLAMFLAQILWESDGLRATSEYACTPNGCGTMYGSDSCCPGKSYHGRGYIQLSWNYNYARASQDLFGNRLVLLRNPDLVANSEDLAWITAFWYWRRYVAPAPGVAQNHFGAVTNAINGALECRGPNQAAARRRFQCYREVLAAFGNPTRPIEAGCYN